MSLPTELWMKIVHDMQWKNYYTVLGAVNRQLKIITATLLNSQFVAAMEASQGSFSKLKSLQSYVPIALPTLKKANFWDKLNQLDDPHTRGYSRFARVNAIRWYLRAAFEGAPVAATWIKTDIIKMQQLKSLEALEVCTEDDLRYLKLVDSDPTATVQQMQTQVMGECEVNFLLGDPPIAKTILHRTGIDTIQLLQNKLDQKIKEMPNLASKSWIDSLLATDKNYIPPLYQPLLPKLFLILFSHMTYPAVFKILWTGPSHEVGFKNLLKMRIKTLLDDEIPDIDSIARFSYRDEFVIVIHKDISTQATPLQKFFKKDHRGEAEYKYCLVVNQDNFDDFRTAFVGTDFKI